MCSSIPSCSSPCSLSFAGRYWGRIWGEAVHQSSKYSLFRVPASALILFSPTVAPASPCSVPREVREFMAAPAVELGVEAATETENMTGRRGEKAPDE